MTVDFSEKPPQKIYTLAFNWMCFWMHEVSLKSDLYVSCLHAWQNMKNYSDKLFWMLHRPLITHFIKLQHCNIIIAIRDKLSIILSTFPRQSLTNKLLIHFAWWGYAVHGFPGKLLHYITLSTYVIDHTRTHWYSYWQIQQWLLKTWKMSQNTIDFF